MPAMVSRTPSFVQLFITRRGVCVSIVDYPLQGLRFQVCSLVPTFLSMSSGNVKHAKSTFDSILRWLDAKVNAGHTSEDFDLVAIVAYPKLLKYSAQVEQ